MTICLLHTFTFKMSTFLHAPYMPIIWLRRVVVSSWHVLTTDQLNISLYHTYFLDICPFICLFATKSYINWLWTPYKTDKTLAHVLCVFVPIKRFIIIIHLICLYADMHNCLKKRCCLGNKHQLALDWIALWVQWCIHLFAKIVLQFHCI